MPHESFDNSRVTGRYAKNVDHSADTMVCILTGSSSRHTVSADDRGVTTVYSSIEELSNRCGTILRTHTSNISSIHMTTDQSCMYTMGMHDECIVEWSMQEVANNPDNNITSCEKNNEDEAMLNIEASFCKRAARPHYLKSAVSYFRGVSNKSYNSILSPCVEECQEENMLDKRYPRCSISLYHVYGYEVSLDYIGIPSQEQHEVRILPEGGRT